MGSGKVDIRFMQRNGKARLRFYNINPDQFEVIMEALNAARNELGTDHDTVALDAICIHFLATYSASHATRGDTRQLHSNRSAIES